MLQYAFCLTVTDLSQHMFQVHVAGAVIVHQAKQELHSPYSPAVQTAACVARSRPSWRASTTHQALMVSTPHHTHMLVSFCAVTCFVPESGTMSVSRLTGQVSSLAGFRPGWERPAGSNSACNPIQLVRKYKLYHNAYADVHNHSPPFKLDTDTPDQVFPELLTSATWSRCALKDVFT